MAEKEQKAAAAEKATDEKPPAKKEDEPKKAEQKKEEKPQASQSASKSNGSGTDSSENGGNGGGNGGGPNRGEGERKGPPSEADLARYRGYVGQKWKGKCRWFNVTKGFGFIDPHFEEAKQHNDDVFVHQSALQMEGFRSLDENEEVEFVVHLGRNGLEAAEVQGADGAKLRGHHVRPLGKKREKMIRCFKCGQLGFHQASRCKKEIPAKACYHCHASDHLVSECPTYLAQKKEREEGKQRRGKKGESSQQSTS